MKVIKNDHNQPLTPAQLEACRQFEQSDRNGQVIFRPQVADGQLRPDCVAFVEGVGRFAVTIREGRYSVDHGQWELHQANGIQVPADNLLKGAWSVGQAVRAELRRQLDIGAYTIAAVWFPDMAAEDEHIVDEAEGRQVGAFFGLVDLVQRLVELPKADQLQPQLSGRQIKREVAALSRSADREGTPPETASLAIGDGPLVIQHVDVLHIHIHIAAGTDAAGGLYLPGILGR